MLGHGCGERRNQEPVMTNKDQVRGRIKEAKGTIKEVSGKLLGKMLQAKGEIAEYSRPSTRCSLPRSRAGTPSAIMHRALLESRPLPAGSDLKRTFIIAMLDHIDAGWLLGEFSSTGAVFFCTRGTVRGMVSIIPCAPDHTSTAAPT
jgi:hypothetical protein